MVWGLITYMCIGVIIFLVTVAREYKEYINEIKSLDGRWNKKSDTYIMVYGIITITLLWPFALIYAIVNKTN